MKLNNWLDWQLEGNPGHLFILETENEGGISPFPPPFTKKGGFSKYWGTSLEFENTAYST